MRGRKSAQRTSRSPMSPCPDDIWPPPPPLAWPSRRVLQAPRGPQCPAAAECWGCRGLSSREYGASSGGGDMSLQDVRLDGGVRGSSPGCLPWL